MMSKSTCMTCALGTLSVQAPPTTSHLDIASVRVRDQPPTARAERFAVSSAWSHRSEYQECTHMEKRASEKGVQHASRFRRAPHRDAQPCDSLVNWLHT